MNKKYIIKYNEHEHFTTFKIRKLLIIIILCFIL